MLDICEKLKSDQSVCPCSYNMFIYLFTSLLVGYNDLLIALYLTICPPSTLYTLIPERPTSTPSLIVKLSRTSLGSDIEKANFHIQSPLCNLRNAPHPQHLLSRAPSGGTSVWASHNPLARLSSLYHALCPCLHCAPLTTYLGSGCASLPSGALG